MTEQRLANRKLPSLAEWLGDGDRVEGFEDWQRFMAEAEHSAASAGDAQTARLIKTLAIAFTEAMRIEAAAGGDLTRAILLFPRLAGVAAMGGTIGALDDEKHPPLVKIARMISEEFAAGARECAKANQRRDAAG